jgi:glycosyltransferase involved in cell wall biosynthesis
VMPPWLLVAGDFTPLGGMDRANHALASYLARRADAEVHLVAHRAWDDLAALPAVRVHRVRRPWGSHWLGMPLLARAGRRWARRLAPLGARVLVNGGNCAWGDVNWVHYVHAAWSPRQGGGPARRAKALAFHGHARAAERACLRRARLVIANSEATRAAVVERLGVPAERVHTVYYGADPGRFRPATAAGRLEARAALGWDDDRPAVAFVGALGDLRKGFDTLFEAWVRLHRDPSWDARLVVAGAGAALAGWRARAAEAGLGESIRFLGFHADVPTLLAACDALVSPARYEAYGLNVQEALCCGLPALVSASAGVAERYPPGLRELLLPDPDDAADLAARLRAWRDARDAYRAAVAPLGEALRGRTWDRCAAEIVALADRDRA